MPNTPTPTPKPPTETFVPDFLAALEPPVPEKPLPRGHRLLRSFVLLVFVGVFVGALGLVGYNFIRGLTSRSSSSAASPAREGDEHQQRTEAFSYMLVAHPPLPRAQHWFVYVGEPSLEKIALPRDENEWPAFWSRTAEVGVLYSALPSPTEQRFHDGNRAANDKLVRVGAGPNASERLARAITDGTKTPLEGELVVDIRGSGLTESQVLESTLALLGRTSPGNEMTTVRIADPAFEHTFHVGTTAQLEAPASAVFEALAEFASSSEQ